jgi:hypothetical protein
MKKNFGKDSWDRSKVMKELLSGNDLQICSDVEHPEL